MTTTVPVPTLGRIVLYRTDGRNGLAYDLPAVVQCTWETHPGDYPCPACHGWGDEPTGVEAAGGVPELQTCPECDGSGTGRRNPLPVPRSPAHVHLTVLTPGGVGAMPVRDGVPVREPSLEDWQGAEAIAGGSGTYVELDVPHDAVVTALRGEQFDPHPRSWRWPARDSRTMTLSGTLPGGGLDLELGGNPNG